MLKLVLSRGGRDELRIALHCFKDQLTYAINRSAKAIEQMQLCSHAIRAEGPLTFLAVFIHSRQLRVFQASHAVWLASLLVDLCQHNLSTSSCGSSCGGWYTFSTAWQPLHARQSTPLTEGFMLRTCTGSSSTIPCVTDCVHPMLRQSTLGAWRPVMPAHNAHCLCCHA